MHRRSAILVIDMANDFLYPTGVIADAGGADYQRRAQSIIPTLQQLLAAARRAGVTVIYATDAHTPADTELRKWPPHSMAGTWQAQIPEALAPEEGDVVIGKTTYSPFVSTEIDDVLEGRNISRLYVTGLHTDCCCRHASGDAFQLGYDLVWVTDGMQAFSDEAHLSGLEYFKTWYATKPEEQLLTTAQVIASWEAVPAAVSA